MLKDEFDPNDSSFLFFLNVLTVTRDCGARGDLLPIFSSEMRDLHLEPMTFIISPVYMHGSMDVIIQYLGQTHLEISIRRLHLNLQVAEFSSDEGQSVG